MKSSIALRAISALLAIGFVGGLIFDPKPERPVVHRAGYRVLEGDFHAHTTFSDGSLTPMGLVRQAERRGLDVIGVTEHNTAIPAKIARAYSKLTGGPIVIVGEEVTTARFHVIALGVSETVSTHDLAKDVVAEIHQKHGLAIAAHPVSRFWPALGPARIDLDGSEVMHPLALSSGSGWRWSEAITFFESDQLDVNGTRLRTGPTARPLAAIGSSDYHFGSVLGLCRTLLFVDEPATEASVLTALHARRTVVIAPDGRRFGDPAMINALEKEPYVTRTSDYAYHGATPVDRVLRTLGWLGLTGLIVFGRLPSLKSPAPSGCRARLRRILTRSGKRRAGASVVGLRER